MIQKSDYPPVNSAALQFKTFQQKKSVPPVMPTTLRFGAGQGVSAEPSVRFSSLNEPPRRRSFLGRIGEKLGFIRPQTSVSNNPTVRSVAPSPSSSRSRGRDNTTTPSSSDSGSTTPIFTATEVGGCHTADTGSCGGTSSCGSSCGGGGE